MSEAATRSPLRPDEQPVLDPFRQRARSSWVTFHTFRKTVATPLGEAGLTAWQIADNLGHAQVSMTMRWIVRPRVARS
jgi:integrase